MMSMHREYNGRAHGVPHTPHNYTDTHTASDNTNTNTPVFHVALITAGELRSFAFVEKSWERYLIKPWKKHIKLFAHIVQTTNCPLASYGLSRLSKLATEYELSSSTSLIPSREIFSRMPSCLTTPEYFPRWQKRFGGFARGNFIDMYTRRKRAYELSRAYGEQHQIEWDLVVFLRLDTAFYDPVIDLYSIYQMIQSHQRVSNITNGIFIPGSCNFGGVCDRFAIGLFSAMEIYFESDWPFQVLDMSCQSPEETQHLLGHIPTDKYEGYVPTMKTIAQLKEELTVHIPTSETILSLWFVMKNLTQLNYDRDIAFATLRVEHAPGYCSLSRSDYIYKYPNKTADGSGFIWDADKHSMYDLTSPFKRGDLEGSWEKRCGNHTLHLDVKKMCLNYPSCSCNKPFGYLYLGI